MDKADRLVLLLVMQPDQQEHLGPSVPVLGPVAAAAVQVLQLVYAARLHLKVSQRLREAVAGVAVVLVPYERHGSLWQQAVNLTAQPGTVPACSIAAWQQTL